MTLRRHWCYNVLESTSVKSHSRLRAAGHLYPSTCGLLMSVLKAPKDGSLSPDLSDDKSHLL